MSPNKQIEMLSRILLLAELQGIDTPSLARRSGLDAEALEQMAIGRLKPTEAQYRRIKSALAATGVGVLPC